MTSLIFATSLQHSFYFIGEKSLYLSCFQEMKLGIDAGPKSSLHGKQ